MRYGYLSEIGATYAAEEGQERRKRCSGLSSLKNQLKTAMADLTNLLDAAPVRPTLTGTGVSNVVKLHEEIAAFEVAEAKRTADIAKARGRVSKFREWRCARERS